MSQHPPYHQPPQGGAPMQKNEPSGMAWACLILGVGSWVILPFLGSVAALIIGMVERKKIANGESPDAGSTVVLIGMIAGGVQVVLVTLTLLGFGVMVCAIPCLAGMAG